MKACRRTTLRGLCYQGVALLWLAMTSAGMANEPETTAADDPQPHAYFAHQVWMGNGPAVTDGVLLVAADGKVTAVGKRGEVNVPDDAVRVELGMQTIVPGFVIAQTRLSSAGQDSEYALSPEVRAVDGFDPFADYQPWLAAGVTSVQLTPGSQRLMPGQGGVVKLASRDETLDQQVLRPSESLSVLLTAQALSPPTIYEPEVGAVSVERPVEPTRPQLATSLAQAIVGLEELFNLAISEELVEELPLEVLRELLAAKATVRFTAQNTAEVQAARRLADRFQLCWLLVDPEDRDAVADIDWASDLAAGVILSPDFRPGRLTNPNVPIPGRKEPSRWWEVAAALVEAGAADKLALCPATDDDLRYLMFWAATLKRGRLSTEQILQSLTTNAAKMLGVEDRVGSLATGLDADFVVLSGEPFASGTRVVETYVDGQRVYNSKLDESSVVIKASHVLTPDGLVAGGLSVNDGKIVAVGSGLSMQGNSTIKRFDGAIVVPGWIDCGTTLGVGGPLGDPLGLDAKIGEWLARDDQQIAVARRGGVTTALLSSSRLPSPVVAFKLGDRPRPLMDPVALRFEISGNLTAAEETMRQLLGRGKAYADAWMKYDAEYAEYQQKLKQYESDKQAYDAAVKAAEEKKAAEAKKAEEAKKASEGADGRKASGDAKPTDGDKEAGQTDEPKGGDGKPSVEAKSGEAKPGESKSAESQSAEKKVDGDSQLKEPTKPTEPKQPNKVAAMEPYRDLFADKLVAMVELSDPRAIELAIQLFREEYKVRTAFVATEATVDQGELLAKHGVLVVMGPTLVSVEDGEWINYPAELAVAGVQLAFQSQAGTGTGNLPEIVSFSVYQGLGQTAAVAGMAQATAKFFKLDSIGELSVGRDADLVVLSGMPFDVATEVLAVMIDGIWVYEKDNQ